VGWKAAPPTDPWEEEQPAPTDPWFTFSVIVGLIAAALVALVAVGAIYVYLVISAGS
jgi:hypothetical protein